MIMLRIILLQVFLISILMTRFLSCDMGQNDQQGNQDNQQGNQDNQQGNQNGDQGNKKDPKYYCDGFEISCPLKKIRLVLHNIKEAMTPSKTFHMPEFKLHNPFGGDSGNDKDKDKNNNQNGDSQNQQGGPNFDPPKFDPPDFKPQNPFGDNSGGNNNQQNGNS